MENIKKRFDLILWIFIIIYMLLIFLDMITAININWNYWNFVNIFGLILFLSDSIINFDKALKKFSIFYIAIVILNIGLITNFTSLNLFKYGDGKRVISYVMVAKMIHFNRKYIKTRKKEMI